ncbi:shikimate dehydrogenase [Candidatus Microgenomates bacterium]|nr:shikimate dehydrogenase [Candidatus Microgenomates bacterium]
MKINGETKIIGFLGSTYKTSKMYTLYNRAFDKLGLNFVYIPFVVKNLKKAVEGIRNLGIAGVGVTIPFKIEIVKYLDELDDNAKRIGAVNVVINNNGKLTGSNTDGLGGIKALKEITDLRNKKVLLLGAGGAARALAFALKDEGAKLTIINRTVEEAENLAKAVGCRFCGLDKISKEISTADILINSTSVGMNPNDNQSLVEKTLLKPNLIIMDLVTHPKETKLIKEAREKGCRIVYGERMLLWQAVLKFKLFTGIEAPVEIMEESLC